MNEWLARYRLAIIGLLVMVIAFFISYAILSSSSKPAGQLVIQLPTPTPESEKMFVVYVSGAVVRDGVYNLKQGSRIADAINAAGGARPEADVGKINLARKVTDEMWIYVPKVGEVLVPGIGSVEEAKADVKININTATAEELDKLPSIGPVTAAKIVDYRSQKGPFSKIEDLRDLKLVYSSVFEKIKDRITVQ